MDCPKCKAANPDGKRFCGDCGASLDVLDEEFRRNVQAILREHLRDQKLVEIETTDAVINRLRTWSKPFLYAFGVVLAVLGVLGFRTMRDIMEALKGAETRAVQTLQEQASHESKSLSKEADAIRAQYRKVADQEDLLTKLKQAEQQVLAVQSGAKKLRERYEQASTELAMQQSPPGGTASASPTRKIGMIASRNPDSSEAPHYFVLGSSGPEVQRIQQRLAELGCYRGAASGDFDTATKTAVERFSQVQGDIPTGIVDPPTWTALFNSSSAPRCR